jgi:hypothetical protein
VRKFQFECLVLCGCRNREAGEKRKTGGDSRSRAQQMKASLHERPPMDCFVGCPNLFWISPIADGIVMQDSWRSNYF